MHASANACTFDRGDDVRVRHHGAEFLAVIVNAFRDADRTQTFEVLTVDGGEDLIVDGSALTPA